MCFAKFFYFINITIILTETIILESINCELPLAEVYAQIEFKDEVEE